MTDSKKIDEEIRERMILFIDYFVGAYSKHKYLEEKTGIAARKWQNLYHRAQMPTVELIWGLGSYQPAYLTWIVTGDAGPEQKDVVQRMNEEEALLAAGEKASKEDIDALTREFFSDKKTTKKK